MVDIARVILYGKPMGMASRRYLCTKWDGRRRMVCVCRNLRQRSISLRLLPV